MQPVHQHTRKRGSTICVQMTDISIKIARIIWRLHLIFTATNHIFAGYCKSHILSPTRSTDLHAMADESSIHEYIHRVTERRPPSFYSSTFSTLEPVLYGYTLSLCFCLEKQAVLSKRAVCVSVSVVSKLMVNPSRLVYLPHSLS